MLYDDNFFQDTRDGSSRSASIVVPLLVEIARPASVIDAGCGAGAWLAEFRKHGVNDILGLDIAECASPLLYVERDAIRRVDFDAPFSLERTFDLAICLEVAEHLREESAAVFIRSLVRLAPLVVFSAAVPGQGGVGHLNEQWPSYWARHFAENGYTVLDCLRDRIWRDEKIEWWYRQNLLLFARNDLAPRYTRETNVRYVSALDRMMPVALRAPAPPREAIEPAATLSAIVLSKDGVGRIERCLSSLLEAARPDLLHVFVDSKTTDETAEAARQFTPHVHSIETGGNIESVLATMASFCPPGYVLRIDDDETLGGNWDRPLIEALLRANELTHLLVPRRWLAPPGDVFIANQPWFPDFQLRLFRNDAALISWPLAIHEPMIVAGRSQISFERWIDHHALIVSSRPERERKCEIYRQQRPEKHFTHFYLYEEQNIDLRPAAAEAFPDAVQVYISSLKPEAIVYAPGSAIDFSSGGNSELYIRDGWSSPEPWGTWTCGYRSQLCLPLERPFAGPALLRVTARAYLNAGHRTLGVRILCNGEFAGEWSIDSPERVERTMILPAKAAGYKHMLILAFCFDSPAAPAESGESSDRRALGLGFYRFSLEVCHAE